MPKNVIWIEDDLTRDKRDVLEELQSSSGEIVWEWKHPEDFQRDLLNDVTISADGFFVDYQLKSKQSEKTSRRSRYLGDTLSANIREDFPDCPILLFSSAVRQPMATEQSSPIDYIYSGEQVRDPELIEGDFLDYFRVQNEWKPNVSPAEQVRAICEAPDACQLAIETAVPSFAQSTPIELAKSEGSTLNSNWDALSIIRWIRRELLRLPGPLYDRFNLAAMLGIEYQFLETYLTHTSINNALYRGPFSRTLDKRLWWKDEVLSRVDQWCREEGRTFDALNVCDSAKSFYQIEPSHLARCSVCRRTGVNVVAVDADDEIERYAVHAGCATVDYDLEIPAGFDSVRRRIDD